MPTRWLCRWWADGGWSGWFVASDTGIFPGCSDGDTLSSMRARPGQFDNLRLAAKASDRATAAQQQWPAFEKRLKQLGYTPLSTAHAFSILSGPGTVAEALAALEHQSL